LSRKREMSASASVLLPEPEGPRISTPRSPSTSAVPCRFVAAATGSGLGRQGQGEARAPDVARLGARDIFRPQGAAMGLHDLPADGQAQPRVLAEGLAGGTVGVEALEDAVDVVGADAGPVVV